MNWSINLSQGSGDRVLIEISGPEKFIALHECCTRHDYEFPVISLQGDPDRPGRDHMGMSEMDVLDIDIVIDPSGDNALQFESSFIEWDAASPKTSEFILNSINSDGNPNTRKKLASRKTRGRTRNIIKQIN